MKSEDIDEAILASLKKLGPSAPRRIADDAGIDPAKVTYAGTRLRKAKLIKTAGRTLNLVWALPEQQIETPSAATRKARKVKKAKAAPRPARKSGAAGRAVANARRANGAPPAPTPEVASEFNRELDRVLSDLAGGTFGRLQRAFEQHLAAITDARGKLFGVTARDLANAAPQPTAT